MDMEAKCGKNWGWLHCAEIVGVVSVEFRQQLGWELQSCITCWGTVCPQLLWTCCCLARLFCLNVTGLSCPSIFICFMFKNFNRMSFNRISSISYLAENIACIVETPWSGLLLSSHAQVRFFRDSFEGGKAMVPKMLTWEASNFIGMLWNLFSLINTSLWKRLSKVSTKSSQIWE